MQRILAVRSGGVCVRACNATNPRARLRAARARLQTAGQNLDRLRQLFAAHQQQGTVTQRDVDRLARAHAPNGARFGSRLLLPRPQPRQWPGAGVPRRGGLPRLRAPPAPGLRPRAHALGRLLLDAQPLPPRRLAPGRRRPEQVDAVAPDEPAARLRQRHRGSGHVWQGRFKAFPIAADEHLRSVLRYVERNPLRAGLVERAEDWPWSRLGLWLRPPLKPLPKMLVSSVLQLHPWGNLSSLV
jgi:hypothetical protein